MNSVPTIVPYKKQGKRNKCLCAPKCKEFFKINEFGVYCKGSLTQLSINILNTINNTNISAKNHRNNGWTSMQEVQLIQYIEQNGVKNGTYSILAVMFGKSRQQVKNKVYYLERNGRLTRWNALEGKSEGS